MSFMLPDPRREQLERLMRHVLEDWQRTTREPVPQDMLDLLARLK